MRITIEIYYIVNGCRSMRKADFPVNMRGYKEDSDKEAARISYEWIKQIRKDHRYDVGVTMVIYNNENDITDRIKKLEEPPDWFYSS